MKFQLGAMSTGDILDRGIKLLFSRLGTFYFLNLFIQSPAILFQFLILESTLSRDVTPLLYYLVSLVCSFVAMGAVLKVVEQEHIGNRIGIGTALAFALSRSILLIAAALVYVVVIGACLLPGACLVSSVVREASSLGAIIAALIVGTLVSLPALAVAMMYALQSQAVALEGYGPISGLGRSRELSADYRWRLFAIVLIKYALIFIVYIALGMAIRMLPFEREYLYLGLAIETLLNLLFSSYGTICLTLAYFDLRTRKEGFDLELAACSGDARELNKDEDDESRDRPLHLPLWDRVIDRELDLRHERDDDPRRDTTEP